MIKTILLILLFYIGYKFIFGFVIPMFNATRQMRNQVQEMTRRMEEQQRSHQVPPQDVSQQQPKPSADDYIDYEELK